MGEPVEGRPRQDRLARHPGERAAELFLDLRDEFFEAPGVEHVFEPRLGAVGAVAMLDIDAHHGIGDLRRLLRLDDDAGVFGEIPMASDAAEREAEPDTGRGAEAILYFDRLETDV